MVDIAKLQNFTAPTFSGNPKIANIFYVMKFIEKRNLGMEELREFSGKMGFRKPVVSYDLPYTRFVIWRTPGAEPTEKEIVEYFEQRDKASSGEYAAYFGLNGKTANRHLNDLVQQGLLGREGERKGTRYFLMKN